MPSALSLLGSGGVADYSQKVLNVFGSSLIAYLPRGEAAGTTATDAGPNGYNGADTNVTLGQAGIGDGRTAPSYNGSTSFTNWFSAGLQGAFNGAEGTLLLWFKVASSGVWTDGVNRRLITLQVNASNRILLERAAANGQLDWTYSAGGTAKGRSKTGLSATGWICIAETWSKSADQVIAYYNGVREGAILTGLGTFAGSLASTTTVIGAASTVPVAVWSGMIAHIALGNTALSATQIATLAVNHG
jgi:hypothetical protein